MPALRCVACFGAHDPSTAGRVKLLLDVNLSPQVVAHLRVLGADAARITDFLDPRAPDDEVLAEARRQSAILVSQDQDMTALLATRGATGPSLVNLRVSEVDPEKLAMLIVAALGSAALELARGAVVTIDDGGMRVHELPIA
jgi:predicted nuclease of predicted toxin-antitoxin system